jgi:hypothetical protein
VSKWLERWKSPGVLMLVECWPHLPHLRLAAKLFLKMDLYDHTIIGLSYELLIILIAKATVIAKATRPIQARANTWSSSVILDPL